MHTGPHNESPRASLRIGFDAANACSKKEQPEQTTGSFVVATSAPVDEDEVCLYPSKKCTNPRARKKNGDLHTMCEYHRIRANENQRRLERRRKAALRFPNRHATQRTLWNRDFPEPIPIHSPERHLLKLRDRNGWQPVELQILLACLFDENDDRLAVAPIAAAWPRTSHTIDLSQLPRPEAV